MRQKIIYTQDNGVLAVISPTPKEFEQKLVKTNAELWSKSIGDKYITQKQEELGDGYKAFVLSELKKHREDNVGLLETLALKAIAERDVPKGFNWRIVDVEDLPLTRTFRDGWADVEGGTKVDTVLTDKLKQSHIQKMYNVELARLPKNALGKVSQSDIDALEAEILSLDVDSVTTLDELYSLWIDNGKRSGPRTYNPFDDRLRQYLPDDDVRK